VLLSIEAMKMESALHSPLHGRVLEVLAVTGQQVEAKDLFVILGSD